MWVRGLPSAVRRVPREAWLCLLVASLNAACWSFITPPFQVPDEPDHYSYVEQLALTGEPPSSQIEKGYSSDEQLALRDLATNNVRLQPENRALFSSEAALRLERELDRVRTEPIVATRDAGVATPEPPLYYALELIPYELGAGGTVLDRLELMRLMSALMAGFTALFVFLFIREALPGVRWAWTVGGMSIALTPLLGFMSGAVTPEAMLYMVAAAAFFSLARTFRRGLTPRRAGMIGVVTAIGLLTKLNFAGFVPGLAFGVVVLVQRVRGPARSTIYRTLGIAAVAVIVLAVGLLTSGVVSRTPLGAPAAAVQSLTRHGSLLGRANYIWQFFLPRLPGTPNDFPGIFTTRQIWFNGLVGLYGWLDTTFPNWVYEAALIPAGAMALFCIRALAAGRGSLRKRGLEILTYALMAAGLLTLVGSASYVGFPEIGGAYAESRYLLPLLAPMGAAIALAARGGGRRWGPTIGVCILMLFVAHDVFSQLQVIARYYG
jgi:4-amino-4-deoxy-L-arabinose transferase-like glycosyltransferase